VADYVGLSDLKTPEALADKRRELEMLRSDDVREWALNRAFYRGQQWVYFDQSLGNVVRLPTDGEMAKWKVRMTSNQILPGVQHYVAQLTKTWPSIYATPDSGALRDRKAAEMASDLFESWQSDFSLRTKLQSALTHAQISQGYWHISYDQLAGKSLRFLTHPENGQLITDEEVEDAFRDELEQMAQQNGMEAAELIGQFEKTIYVGEIKVEVLPGENVILDPTANQFADAKYAICRHALSPEEIKARWPKAGDVAPDSAPADTDLKLWLRDNDRMPAQTKNVYFGYFRPSPGMPKGRYVVWIEEPFKILVDEAWPYPFTELPLVKFPGIERPDSALDEARVTHARPGQKDLNRFLSQLSEFRNMTLKPQMIAPIGSLRQRITSEPGAVFEFQPVQGLSPEWRQVPNMPGYVMDMLVDAQMRLDKIFNRMPSQRDQLPARLDAGYGIELLQEAVADQMSTEMARIEEALTRAGTLMVKLAQTYYIEPRLMKIKGANGSLQVKKFMRADLEGGFTFRVEAGSGLPRSRAGRQQSIIELVDKQLLRPEDAMRMLDLGDKKGVMLERQLDEDQAYREHEKLLKGTPINPTAVHQAMMAVNQGMNPQTNKPIQSEDEVEQIFQMAMVMPLPVINPHVHLATHDGWIKTVEFENLPLEVQMRVLQHRDMEMQMLQSQKPVDPKGLPKISVNTRSTVSPQVMQKMLEASGIEASVEEVSAPPLETAVYDSVDKPDMDEAGNDTLTQIEQLQAMETHRADTELKLATAKQKLAQAEAQAEMESERHEIQLRRDEERHQQELSQRDEMHSVKKTQAAKPKPQGGSRA